MPTIRMYMNMEMGDKTVKEMCQSQNIDVNTLALSLKLGLLQVMKDCVATEDIKLDYDVEIIED